jgi:hypothetical protein
MPDTDPEPETYTGTDYPIKPGQDAYGNAVAVGQENGPFMRGKFSIYQTPNGGLLLAYQLEGEEETRRIPLPAAAMAAARQFQEGGGMFGALRQMTRRG